MMYGDISNIGGSTIAFRCEDFLINWRDNTFKDKILNAVMGKTKRAEVNLQVSRVLEDLYRNTEYNVDIVVENKNYDSDMKKIFETLCFGRVILIDKESQISSRLLTGDIFYYVDDNDYRRSLVNSSYAVSLEEFLKNVRKMGRER